MELNERRTPRDLENILKSEDISSENKEDIKEFLRWLEDRELSDSRKARYLQSAKKVLEYNDLRLREADHSKIRELHRQIQDSAYYHSEYSAETKCEYKKFLRSYFKWSSGGHEVPEKADFLSVSVKESIKDRTRPQDIPKPQDVKFLCQNLQSIRDKALLLTHWDLGSRIGETLNIKVGDYYQEGEAKYIRVEGNKTSPNRNPRVIIAPPAIDKWLEKHPAPEDDDAYLFCLREPREEMEKDIARKPASYRYFAGQLRKAKRESGVDCDVNTHAIRKARISFLKSLGVPESSVDKRVGHVIGSDVTREYTRLSDSDSNRAYARGYGEEQSEEDLEDDLLPLTCGDCRRVNPGYRDRCLECANLLDINEKPRIRSQEDKARKLLWETIKEKGIDKEILEKL